MSIKNKVSYEFSQIEKEYEVLDLIIKKLNLIGLDEIELRAASASLQSIYNGFEKILVQIFKEYKFEIPKTQSWHSDLLKQSVVMNIISVTMEKELRDYMGFRHFFRHAYSFMLDPELIEPLLMDLNKTIESFQFEIRVFLDKG